jgi:hypothetical protein
MLLITTLVHYPGIGCPPDEAIMDQEKKSHHNSLSLLPQQIALMAQKMNLKIEKPAIATLRKDLETLKDFGILERRMYRWGYYLGTGVMNKRELKLVFDALESMAIYQGDSIARKIHRQLKKRIRGLEINQEDDFFYPLRRNMNRSINYTDPDEMMEKGQNQNNLYHEIETLEEAILKGQTIELARKQDLYNQGNIGKETIIPLQLLYLDTAWYLIYEQYQDGQLIVGRINRFANYVKVFLLF